MWRTAVLPRALYGCEVLNVTMTQMIPVWITWKRIKAHNDAAAAASDVEALGNKAVDILAKQAGVVLGAVHHSYAVQLCDAFGTWQLNLSSAVPLACW